MKLTALALGLALAVAAALPASAQRGGGQGAWELLGQENVGLGGDRDSIVIKQSEDYFRDKAFRRLRFVVDGGDVKVRRVKLIYINGAVEELNFNRELKAGQQVDVDLRGERSYLRQIDFDYATKFGFSFGGGGIRLNQAVMRVYGENFRGGPPPAPVAFIPPPPTRDGRWHDIGDARFDRTDNRVEIRVGRDEGRLGQIRLRLDGERVTVTGLRIVFGRGETQNITFTGDLEDGQWSRAIDLVGDRRVVDRVVVLLNPRRRPGPAEISLQGTDRPGRDFEPPRAAPPGRNSWVPLGRQSVGFGTGRDVIRVGQGEAWFRDRGFDKLHFTAETNEVYMQSIRVVYLNGSVEDYRVERLIPAGGDLAVDLPGSRSYIREIQMNYRSRPGFRGESILSVFGEPMRR